MKHYRQASPNGYICLIKANPILSFPKNKVILAFLKSKGIEVAYFNGSMRKKDKENQIRLFRDKSDILVSTDSGGEGRNLQFCNGMINFDLPWNPMAIEQRIGILWRYSY